MVTRSERLVALFFGITLAAALLVAGRARAEEPATASPPESTRTRADPNRPWADSVSENAQKQALALFEEGNKLFETSQHAAALAISRGAQVLGPPGHPLQRGGCPHQPRPAARREREPRARAPLRRGAVQSDTYQQALTYQKLLRGQLAQLKVTCTEPGAEVTLDGAPLFVAPGEASRWLLPGPHQVVVRKAGFLTETRSLTLLPGRPASEAVVLQEIRRVPPPTQRSAAGRRGRPGLSLAAASLSARSACQSCSTPRATSTLSTTGSLSRARPDARRARCLRGFWMSETAATPKTSSRFRSSPSGERLQREGSRC